MKFVQLSPHKAWHTNGTLLGFSGVASMPVTRHTQDGQPITASAWKASFWTRIKFLFCGQVQVSLIGETHPPISVGLGEIFVRRSS